MEIQSRRSDYDIQSLYRKLSRDQITFSSLSNSTESWSLKQKKAYVESVILGFPTSPFISVQNEDGSLKIVDGIKRLKAIIGFLNDEFEVFPQMNEFESIFNCESCYSDLEEKWKFKISCIVQPVIVHQFDNPKHADLFEKRLHSDFEVLARKITVIDRCLTFDNDSYAEGLILISKFNQYLMNKYPDRNISIKIQQEGAKIRLVVETEETSKVEVEHILDDFNKQILRQLQETSGLNENGIVINLNNNNVVSNNIDINLTNKINRTNGLVNELIEELSSEPELQKQLEKVIKSSESVKSPEELPNSSFLSKLSRVMEQAKEKGTTLNNIINKSKECADLVKKISENTELLTGMF